MTHRELLKQALEALEDLGMKHYQNTGEVLYGDVYEALKSAITEPEFPIGQATTDVGVPVYVVKKAVQEPVAIRLSNGVIDVLGGSLVPIGTLLYTAPPSNVPTGSQHNMNKQKPVAWIYEFWADRGHRGLDFQPQNSADNTPLYLDAPELVYIQNNIMKTALEQIAGTRAIIDNLLSDKDIARITLDRIRLQDEHSTGLRPTP